jgi:hypothetical protein
MLAFVIGNRIDNLKGDNLARRWQQVPQGTDA